MIDSRELSSAPNRKRRHSATNARIDALITGWVLRVAVQYPGKFYQLVHVVAPQSVGVVPARTVRQ